MHIHIHLCWSIHSYELAKTGNSDMKTTNIYAEIWNAEFGLFDWQFWMTFMHEDEIFVTDWNDIQVNECEYYTDPLSTIQVNYTVLLMLPLIIIKNIEIQQRSLFNQLKLNLWTKWISSPT